MAATKVSLLLHDTRCREFPILTNAHAPNASDNVHSTEDAAPVRGRIVVKRDRYNGDYAFVPSVGCEFVIGVRTCLKTPPE